MEIFLQECYSKEEMKRQKDFKLEQKKDMDDVGPQKKEEGDCVIF